VNELEERLRSVLSDPGELGRLAAMAKQLMGGESGAPESPPPPPADSAGGLGAAVKLMSRLSGRGKAPLLDAVGPYLDEERRGRLERALRLASAAKAALPALRELGGGHGL